MNYCLTVNDMMSKQNCIGVLFFNLVWINVWWYDMVWYGVMWYVIWWDMHITIWYDKIRYDTIRYNYDMICFLPHSLLTSLIIGPFGQDLLIELITCITGTLFPQNDADFLLWVQEERILDMVKRATKNE